MHWNQNEENAARYNAAIPEQLWAELDAQGLLGAQNTTEHAGTTPI